MIDVWTMQDGKPYRMVAEAFGHPNICSDPNNRYARQTQYSNTHFLTEAEAAKYALDDAEAGRKLAIRKVQELRRGLEEAEGDLVNAVLAEASAQEVWDKLNDPR
jgi:UDP-N-acetylglucosamine:LPS N-acetylglucosamine transferase